MTPLVMTPLGGTPEQSEPDVASTVAMQQVPVSPAAFSDEVTMLLVGTILIGLAAAVRRTA